MAQGARHDGRMEDWVAWHRLYDDPGSPLRARLDCVTLHLRGALDQSPPGPIRLLSLCAGQGRDVLEVLPAHPRGRDVCATLVEADTENARLARQAADDAGLSEVRVREAEVAFDELDGQYLASVGVHRLTRRRAGTLAEQPLFAFGSHRA